MGQVQSVLAASTELAGDPEFQRIIKAATYRATMAMGTQVGNTPEAAAAAQQRLVLVERVVMNGDPMWTSSLHWAMAADDTIITAYLEAGRAVSGLGDAVVMAALEGVWRKFAVLLAAAAAVRQPQVDTPSTGTTPDTTTPEPEVTPESPDEPGADPTPTPEPTPEPAPEEPPADETTT